jgi:hypothetical protein
MLLASRRQCCASAGIAAAFISQSRQPAAAKAVDPTDTAFSVGGDFAPDGSCLSFQVEVKVFCLLLLCLK